MPTGTIETIAAPQVAQTVEDIVAKTPILDVHTHLYAPDFGPLSLWGIDELVNYHYLVAELFRSHRMSVDKFWLMSKREQADLIWDTLFVKNTPISEATRGIVAVMSAFGLDPGAPDLKEARRFFASKKLQQHIDEVLRIANVSEVVMTNDIFDETEAALWDKGAGGNAQFHAVLRMDPILVKWESAVEKLAARGYGDNASETRRFLADWIKKMKPLYLAVSLPSRFQYPDDTERTRLLRDVVFPTCREHDIPFAMMIGVRKGANPALRDAGDSLGHADIEAVERICLENPDNRFLVTMLSRENQHELCVAARKFANLMPFGCWWFMNNPSIIMEITRERLEMLGASFIPQHSDARILDQLIYKWQHSRRVIGEALTITYNDLIRDGWSVTREQIERDVKRMFSGNFREWVGLKQS